MPSPPEHMAPESMESETHQSRIHRAAYETLIYSLSRIIPSLATFIGIKIFSGWYSQEEYGQYATVMALSLLISSFGTGWLQAALLRNYPEWKLRGQESILFSGVWLGVALSIGLVGILCLAGWMFRESGIGQILKTDLLGWVLVMVVVTSVMNMGLGFFRASREVGAFSIFSGLLSFSRLTGGIVVTLLLGAVASSLISGTAIGLLLVTIWMVWSLFCRQGQIVKPSMSCLRELFLFGFPLSIGQFSSQILNVSDRYLISILRNDAEAGVYAINHDIADASVRLIIMTLLLSGYTAVTECFEKAGREAAEKLVSSLSRMYILLALPVVVGTYFTQHDLVLLIADPKYAEGSDILFWVSFGVFLLGLSFYQDLGLHIARKSGLLASIVTASACINILLNLLFIPILGFRASAYSAFITFALLSVTIPIFSRRWLAWRIPWLCLARIGIALVGMATVVALLGGVSETPYIRLAVQVSLGAITYFGLIFLMGELNWRSFLKLTVQSISRDDPPAV